MPDLSGVVDDDHREREPAGNPWRETAIHGSLGSFPWLFRERTGTARGPADQDLRRRNHGTAV
ncbi:hypothetical protein [Streptomyces sp. HPF1205]|uniref:hypothetical protein n=1 Tax=Streptomyces sp. HPF1205 TaxID=2873262 RepID=UPI001CEDFCA6|nr:hypothetical protein [Streptomyces sp. HPF1205]